MEINIAIALDENGKIQRGHFGEAFLYAVYTLDDDKWRHIESIYNSMQNFDEHTHGSARKGKSVVSLLHEKNIAAVVSQQFGQNINIIRQYFKPVIAQSDDTEIVLNYLRKNSELFISESVTKPYKPHKIP